MPNIHYVIPCYTIDLLEKADKTLKHLFQNGGSVTGLSKSSTTLNIFSHAMPSKIMEAGKLFSEKMMA